MGTAVNKHLQKVCTHLGFSGIGSHSFRKFFATSIYNNNKHDINLVRVLLQHSSIAVTQRYIGIQSEEIEEALQKHIHLI
ncbi:tyrosine-type recombinase/integrase [Blautia obeum]|uniref:tyrosine-type recombinase/integrase n=1 Tax=Blautia obeum TaxID=40520 RepID=UPI003F889B77